MHKCIMVKVGGKRNTHKVCKKQGNFSKTGGNFSKQRGNNNFCKRGGIYWNRENRGKFEICGRWLKKVIRNFGRWKSRIFGEHFPESEKFSKIGGIWNRGENASWPQGGGTPLEETAVEKQRMYKAGQYVRQGLKTHRLSLPRYWARDPNRREGFSSLQFFNSPGPCEFAITCKVAARF